MYLVGALTARLQLYNIVRLITWVNFTPPTPPLSCIASPVSVVAGSSVALSATGGNPSYPYSWSSSNTADIFGSKEGAKTSVTPMGGGALRTFTVMTGNSLAAFCPLITITQPKAQLEVLINDQIPSSENTAFANTEMNKTSATKIISVRKVGTIDVKYNFETTPFMSGDFSYSKPIGSSLYLTTNNSANLTNIAFTPTKEGPLSSTITIHYRGIQETIYSNLTVNFSGKGTPVAPTATLWIVGAGGTHLPGPVEVARGTKVKLGWTSTAADTCEASGTSEWTGSRASSNSIGIEVTPSQAQNIYSLTCYKAGVPSIPAIVTVNVLDSVTGTNIRDL